jgi:hypothetical protein
MDSAQRFRLTEVDWLANSPIGPYAAAFKRHLTKRRYAAHTIASYVAEITHFARWACTRRVPLARIDEVSIAIFLDDHLPSCACTGPVRHDRGDHSAALGHLLLVLRAQDAIAPSPVSTAPVDEELRRYDEHMDHVRGLAPRTRSSALRIVGRLLGERFGGDAINIAAIKPEHVRRFFAEQATLYRKPAGAGCVVSSLRGYFRYRASLGDRVHGLIGALSYPANRAGRHRLARRHDHTAPHQGPPSRHPAAAGNHRRGHRQVSGTGAAEDLEPSHLRAQRGAAR